MLKLDKNKGDMKTGAVLKKIPKTLAKIKKMCIIDSVGAQTIEMGTLPKIPS